MMGYVHKILVGKPKGKRSLGRHRHRQKDNFYIGSERKRVGGCALDSSGSEQGSAGGSYEHSNELSGSIKGREFLQEI
jgi:hypothetical protein